MASLLEFAQANYSSDPVTKPLRYYEVYEQALREEGLSPKTILEIGVYQGESVKVLARCFPSAHIVAVDLNLRDIDFSGYENVHYLQCDQSDGARLRSICEEHFPNGVDLVIDDASHIGHLSRLTFDYVFPYVTNGGLYIVEDWGTGYWDTWIDGSGFMDSKVPATAGRIARRVPSHDFGMVGFVKSLVDYTATDDIAKAPVATHRWASRLILSLARLRSLGRLVDRMPGLKRRLARVLDAPGSTHKPAGTSTSPELPRLKSLKFFRGVCIACKA